MEARPSSPLPGGGHTVSLVSRPQVPASLSWLDLGPRAESGEVTLYAAHEATGEVSRLQLAADLGTVTTLETVQLPGAGPAHVLADRERVRLSGLEVGMYEVNVMPGSAVLRQLRQRHLDGAGPGLLGRAGRRAQTRAVPRPRPQLHQVRCQPATADT